MVIVRIRNKGAIEGIMIKARLATMKSATKLAEEVKTLAIKKYLDQRQSSNPTSLIVQSFFVIPAYMVGSNRVMAHVSVGGPSAPYAIYVEEGHTYKNGTEFKGYHFVRDAVIDVQKTADLTVLKEFKKIF